MTSYKVLVELGFGALISEASAQTQTGSEMLNKYKSFLMANPESCGVVNSFVREAAALKYDSVLYAILEQVSDYIQQNKTSWALASACESIKNSTHSFNMLNRNAATQVEKLLEQEEDQVVKYVRAGALKNVMFCEHFRNIAKQVFAGNAVVEAKADYTQMHPVSMVESVGDGHCFVVAGRLYKTNESGELMETSVNEVSNTFKQVSTLLASKLCTVVENGVNIKYGNAEYIITEENTITKKQGEEERKFTTEQFRDHSRLMLMTANPRKKPEMAGVLESIALVSENIDNIVSLDNVTIYTTAADKFVVIESGNNLYATSMSSTRHPQWTINEDALKALSFIKSKTNVELSENYKNIVEKVVEQATANHKEEMEKQLHENSVLNIKERIELLTEKFKGDPAKLAVLSKLAAELQTL